MTDVTNECNFMCSDQTFGHRLSKQNNDWTYSEKRFHEGIVTGQIVYHHNPVIPTSVYDDEIVRSFRIK